MRPVHAELVAEDDPGQRQEEDQEEARTQDPKRRGGPIEMDEPGLDGGRIERRFEVRLDRSGPLGHRQARQPVEQLRQSTGVRMRIRTREDLAVHEDILGVDRHGPDLVQGDDPLGVRGPGPEQGGRGRVGIGMLGCDGHRPVRADHRRAERRQRIAEDDAPAIVPQVSRRVRERERPREERVAKHHRTSRRPEQAVGQVNDDDNQQELLVIRHEGPERMADPEARRSGTTGVRQWGCASARRSGFARLATPTGAVRPPPCPATRSACRRSS